jgi:hypothetical protein
MVVKKKIEFFFSFSSGYPLLILRRDPGTLSPSPKSWFEFGSKSVLEFAPSDCRLAVRKVGDCPPHPIPELLPASLGAIPRRHRRGPAARVPFTVCTGVFLGL